MLRKTWFGGVFKPKNLHSLEHLRYLYSVLSKNQTVSESNRGLLVETLRSIAEILIWGDQNDSSVFDFFLEKNMLSFFLRIMKQKCGSYVCVQLLQTLNILFENIRNETSLYYLLSNNHVNSIIVHKFDFSDEEVMAYYISFLKTLSFKLNNHTIHFFYNEHTNDFPLYTEAIKFFNHPESMVRIAVRTLTLNVYRVNDQSMLQFIRDRTAAPYFSNLVWFIGNHILELDACVRDDIDHDSRDRLSGLVAEHLDHLHYLNDILRLRITPLNHLLAHHLLHRLLLPLLVHSLLPPDTPRHHSHHHIQEVGQPPPLDRSSPRRPRSPLEDTDSDESVSASAGVEMGLRAGVPPAPRVSKVVALFLLAQVFLILSFPPLVHTLARTLLHAGASLLHHYTNDSKSCKSKPGFVAPEESLEKSLLTYGVSSPRRSMTSASLKSAAATTDSAQYSQGETSSSADGGSNTHDPSSQTDSGLLCGTDRPSSAAPGATDDDTLQGLGSHRSLQEETAQLNITDEEKQQLLAYQLPSCCMQPGERSLASRPFLQSVLEALDCRDNDYTALFALCLLYALGHNNGFSDRLLSDAFIETPSQEESEAAATRGPRLVPTALISGADCEAGANDHGRTSQLDKPEEDANNRRENSPYSNHVGDGGHTGYVEHNTLNNVRKDCDDEALPNFVTNDDRRGSDDTVSGNRIELVPPTTNERRSSSKSIDFERRDSSSSSSRLRQGNCQVSSPMALPSNCQSCYSTVLVEKMLHVISHSAQYSSKVRVVTLEVAIQVLRQVVGLENASVSATNGPSTSLPDSIHPASRSQSPSSNHIKDGCKTVTENSSTSSHNYPANSHNNFTDNCSYGIDAVSTVDCTTTTASVAAAPHSSQLTPSCSCPEATSDGPCSSCNSLPRASVASCDAPLRKCSFTELDAHRSGSGSDHPSTLTSVANKSSRKSSIPEEGGSKMRLARRNRPVSGNKASLSDEHLAVLEGAREEATLVLRNFYKSEEMFLDLFEDEWNCCNNSQSAASRGSSGRSDSVHVEYLLQDSNVLLPPTATPLTGIHLNKRRPCGEVERARRAMRVFFLVRGVCLAMRGERDAQLPLTRPSACVRVHDVLDLNNSDLIACVVITRDGERSRRFLVIDVLQLILVEPDQRRLGWGVAKFVGFLQDLEVTGDKDDSRVLHLTLHRPAASAAPANSRAAPPAPLLAAKFIFDDHIRCMAAKQRLCKGRNKARQRKLHQIARLLELPSHLQPCPSPPGHALSAMRQEAHHHHRRGLSSQRTAGSSEGRSSRYGGGGSSRYSSRGPGRATQHVAGGGGGSSGAAGGGRASPESGADHRHGGSRQQIAGVVEEIQLEDIGGQQSVVIHPALRRL